MTDPLGQSQVIPYLEGLSKFEYEITLISTEKPEQKHKTQQIQSLLTKGKIHWQPITYTKKPPIISTLYDVLKLKKLATKIVKEKNVKIVHCRSYIAAIVGLHLKKKYGVKFIFDMRGFYADERVDGKIWALSNPIYKQVYKFFKNKENEFLSFADYTVSLTNNGKNEILSWNKPTPKSPIEVIPCCADLVHFSSENIDNEKKENFKTQLNIAPQDFILSYLGSIGTWYMLPEMLDFFKVLKEYKPTAKFLFITADNPTNILNEAKAKQINEKDLIIIRAERNDVPTLLSLSQLSIFFILPVFSKKASSPTKQGEIMGMGIPIICNAGVGDTDYVINNYQCGALIHEFTEKKYHYICKDLEAVLSIEKKNMIEGAKAFYALESGIEKYNKIYEEVLQTN